MALIRSDPDCLATVASFQSISLAEFGGVRALGESEDSPKGTVCEVELRRGWRALRWLSLLGVTNSLAVKGVVSAPIGASFSHFSGEKRERRALCAITQMPCSGGIASNT